MNVPLPDLLDPVTSLDHARGAAHPRVTIVEYGDFECPVCRSAEAGLQMILDRAPELIRLVYRQRVREQIAGAVRGHLRATPGFYVNGRVCDVSGGLQLLADRVGALL